MEIHDRLEIAETPVYKEHSLRGKWDGGTDAKQSPDELLEVDPTNVFVKYLPPDVKDSTLRKLFSTFGEVVSCKVMVDTITGSSLGYGCVRLLVFIVCCVEVHEQLRSVQ